MPRLIGFPYDEARQYFQPLTKGGKPRCQSFAKGKLRKLRAEGKPDDPQVVALAQCEKPARLGFQVCQYHGAGRHKPGGRPLKSGAYSTVLPEHLLKRYEESLEDPDILAMQNELALLRTYIGDIIKQWGDDPPNTEEMADAIESMGAALRAGELKEAQDEFLRLERVFLSGRGKFAALREIRGMVEQLRRVSTTERARLVAAEQIITVREAMALVANLVRILKKSFHGMIGYKCPDCGHAFAPVATSALELAVFEVRGLLERGNPTQREVDEAETYY